MIVQCIEKYYKMNIIKGLRLRQTLNHQYLREKRCDAEPKWLFDGENPLFNIVVIKVRAVEETVRTVAIHHPDEETEYK